MFVVLLKNQPIVSYAAAARLALYLLLWASQLGLSTQLIRKANLIG